MSSKNQMKRGKNQSLYKYLPETWIDFSVRGKERKQYIAKVERWNGVKLEDVNAQRLIRTVNDAVQSFASQSTGGNPAVPPVLGFGAELTKFNCDVLTPRVSEEERSIVARISPLTFYCKHCYKVYQFNSEENYRSNHRCFNCHTELTQFRQIYFCKCGYATDKHNVRCPEHGFQHIKWDGKYNFVCTKPGCNRKIPMQATCPVCNSRLGPKVALDPAQFFVFSLSLIDLIDERLENFIADTEEGPFLSFAYWLNLINKEELDKLIQTGIVSDPDEYQRVYDQQFAMFMGVFHDEAMAALAAKTAADNMCGNKYNAIVNEMKGKIATTEKSLASLAERILEFDLVTRLEDVSDLDSAIEVARLLNTNANPEKYAEVAARYGIASARVCDRIPFVSCSYGYTRGESDYKEGVQLHALKEETPGRKNIYATKLNTKSKTADEIIAANTPFRQFFIKFTCKIKTPLTNIFVICL